MEKKDLDKFEKALELISICPNCGRNRRKVFENELPSEISNFITKKNIIAFSCDSCEEYSFVLDINMGKSK